MTSAPTKHTCRACPAVIASGGTGYCRACQRLISLAPAPDTREAVVCEHYQTLVRVLVAWIADCGWCAVCGAELPDTAPDTAPLKHKPDCALALIVEAQPQ